MFFLPVLILAALMGLSVRQRILNRKRSKLSGDRELPVDSKPSPFTHALTELMAVAGGIYLSLLLLANFLSLNIPDIVAILGFEINPLALLSIIIASIQPFFVKK